MSTAETTPTQYVEAANNVKFAYRRFGHSADNVPIIMNIHFRGSMDFWDPLLVNTLAKEREVILFDNAGVGRSTGQVPETFAGWASDLIAFAAALGLEKIDLFGFSMGGIAVLEAALASPHLVRKFVMAGSKASVPEKGPIPGIVWPQDQVPVEPVVGLVSAVTLEEGRNGLKISCFPLDDRAQSAADRYWKRLQTRTAEPVQLELLPMDPNGARQLTALAHADTPRPGASFDRLGELKMPALIMNGDNDALIPTSRSWELLKMVENAQLIIYPRSGHGFLWQYPVRVAEDVNRFLNGPDLE